MPDTPLQSANDVLSDYIGVFLVALVISFIATPINRWLATKNGLVDLPDLRRKNHLEPVAYLGGVAILMGWLAGVYISYMLAPTTTESSTNPAIAGHFPLPVVFGATVITLTGVIDDVYSISPRVKIGGQFMAAAAMAMSSQSLGTKLVGDVIASTGYPAPWPIAYILGAVLLAVFVVGGCNSMNLLDGLDGLAAGVGAIACAGFLFISVYAAIQMPDPAMDGVRIVTCLAVLGALMGFLPYNFNPANIFMGDAGSLLLGYLCVSTILLFADAPHSGPRLVMAALIVFALPITDTAMAIARRLFRKTSISSGDTDHIHHQIHRAVQKFNLGPNLSVKLAVLTMYAIATGFAVLGCSVVFLRWRYAMMVFFTLFAFILVGAYKSGRRRALIDALDQQTPPPAVATDSPTA